MKKIIQGKLCDTATAKELGSYSYSHPSQFNWYRETLYRTNSGVYFIHGEGNAASPYACACPTGGFDPGEKIRIVSLDAAKAWAEKNLDADKYIALFGDPEGESEVRIGVTVSAAARKRLEELKAVTGMSYGEIVEAAIMGDDKK